MICLIVAGVLQIAVAAANLPLAWLLRFGREDARLLPLVRQIHRVHHAYLMALLGVFAILSIAFADDLRNGCPLGRFLSGVLALFWGARLAVQRFYYDRDFLRRHRAGDVAFSLVFGYLAAVYAASAAGVFK